MRWGGTTERFYTSTASSYLHKMHGRENSEREARERSGASFPASWMSFRDSRRAATPNTKRLVAFMLTIGIESSSAKCSVFGASSDAGVIFGRNYDFFYKYKRFTENYLTVPDDGLASVGNSDVFIGREDGVNEKGLAVGITFVTPRTVKPGINFPLVTRFVLDRSSNIGEAIKELRRFHFSTTNNYLLADASGDLAVVEASPKRTEVRRPHGRSFIVCTNHFVHPGMSVMEDVSERDSDSVRRYATISDEIKRRNDKVTLRSARTILSNHAGGVCSHREELRLGTLWSVIADLPSRRIMLAEGQPCKVDYEPDTRLREAVIRRNKPADGT
jgi:predicted choloylglycine hydrolase